MRLRAPSLLVASLLVVVALAYWETRMVASVPMPQKVIRWSADLYEAYLPSWTLAYRGPHLLPRWNPWQRAGTPAVASTTSGLLYPMNLLATLVPVPLAIGWLSAAHVALAGVLTFAGTRALGLARPVSAFAAVVFMLSGRVLGERIHTLNLFGVCWIPGVLFCAGRLVRAPSLRAGMLLGTALAVQLLTGYAEIVCFTGYALVVLIGTELVVSGVDRHRRRRLVMPLVVAVATAAGLAAVQLLPTLELIRRAGRGGERLPLADIMVFPPPTLRDLLRESGWMLPLAVVAATDRRRSATVAAAAAVLALSWLVGLGTGFYSYVFYRLPGVALFRLPQAILPIGELALAVLAAIGLQRALAFVPWRRGRQVIAWAVVGVVLLGRWTQPGSIIMMPQNNATAFFAPPPVVQFLRSRTGIDRVLVIKNWSDRFPLMERMGTLYRLPVAQDYDQLTATEYRRFLAPLRDFFVEPYFIGRYFPAPSHPGWRRLDLLGVRWIVVAPGVAWRGDRVGRFQLVYDARDGRVFENLSSRPRAFLVHRWRVGGEDAMLAALDTPDFDPGAEVVLDRDPQWPTEHDAPSLSAAVRVERYAEDEANIVVETPRKAILVLTDLYWPGWQVEVDGERRVLQRADFLFRAVALEAGEHRIHFRYASSTFRLGLLVTAIAATAVLVVLVLGEPARPIFG